MGGVAPGESGICEYAYCGKPFINTSSQKGKRFCCRACGRNNARRIRRERDREKYRTQEREQYHKHREYFAARGKVWLRNNQHKKQAHIAVFVARHKGVLVPPDVCSSCGSDSRLDAHHDDYSKPLEVRWLCRSCHSRHHAYERKAAA